MDVRLKNLLKHKSWVKYKRLSLNNQVHLVANHILINPIYLQQAYYFGLETEFMKIKIPASI